VKKECIKGENLLISILTEKQLDEKFSFSLLRNLSLKAGLTPYGTPQIFQFPNEQVKTEEGISGIQLMIESHCAFHWWRQNNYVNITISSCRPISIVPVIEFLKEVFASNNVLWIKTLWPDPEIY